MRLGAIILLLVSLVLASCNTPSSTSLATDSPSPPTMFAASHTPQSTRTSSPTFVPPSPTAVSPTNTTVPPSVTPSTTPTRPPESGDAIVLDQNAVAVFDQLTDDWIEAAAAIRYLHRASSIGVNINLALDCLQTNPPNFPRRPNFCGPLVDARFDRTNFVFQARPNPGWIGKVQDFVEQINLQHASFDAVGFLVDYVDGQDGATYPAISDPENFQTRYIEPLEALEAAHPDKTFVWWTMSLARIGFENEQRFNEMLREYARANDKILFDIAAIEAHSPDGVHTLDTNGIEVMYPGYTDEEGSGHLNPAGGERLAKAVWVLMATLAGWDGALP